MIHKVKILLTAFLFYFPICLASKVIKGPVQVGIIKMSPIGCGTWAWGNRFLWGYNVDEDKNLQEAFNFVVKNGVNWFDTADSYGTGSLNGRSESLLGKFFNELPQSLRDKNYICTKLAPYPWRIGTESMNVAYKESTERLMRKVDVLQLHWPPSLGWQEKEYLLSFGNQVKSGKAKQIGLSNYGPQGLQRVVNILKSNGNRVYSNQVQFSLLSRYPLTSGLMEVCEENNIQLIGYSSLGLGLLTDKYSIDKLPSGPRGILFREYLPGMKILLGELRDIAKARNKSVPQVALNWCLCKGALGLVGIRSIQQAKDNLAAVGWSLTPSEIVTLDKAASKTPKQLIQNSFQSS